MAELRELLHEASPPASGEADLDDLRSRVRRRHRTRRAVTAMVIVGTVPLLGVAVVRLRPSLELLDATRRRIEFYETRPEQSEAVEALEPERVSVPEVEGLTLPEAEEALRAAGLTGGPALGQGVIDPTDPEAVVVAQEPPAGVEAWPGAAVGFRTALVTAELCDVLRDLPPRRGDALDLATTDGYWEMLRRAEPLADPPLAKAIDELNSHHERDERIELAPTWALDSVAIHHDACSRGMR